MRTTSNIHFEDAKIVKTLGSISYGEAISRHIGADITAGLKSIVGGEIKSYTKLLNDGREQAMERLEEECTKLGGNAIINVQYSTSTVGNDIFEILVYGTAVIIEE